MSRWIGGTTGDRRVIRYDTGKIYSCPEGASYDFKVPPYDVINACQKLVKRVYGTEIAVDWYAQYLNDTPRHLWIHRTPLIFVERVQKITEGTEFRQKGVSLESWTSLIPAIYEAITSFLDKTGLWDMSLPISTYCNIWNEYRNHEPTSSNSFARHFTSHYRIYERILGMKQSKIYSVKAHKEILALSFSKITGIRERDMKEITDWDSTTEDPSGKVSHSIVRLADDLNAEMIFGSLRVARQKTGIDANKILFCCEGDLDYADKFAKRYIFRYVKWI